MDEVFGVFVPEFISLLSFSIRKFNYAIQAVLFRLTFISKTYTDRYYRWVFAFCLHKIMNYIVWIWACYVRLVWGFFLFYFGKINCFKMNVDRMTNRSGVDSFDAWRLYMRCYVDNETGINFSYLIFGIYLICLLLGHTTY